MRVIIVHCDAQIAGRTGLFGLGAAARLRVLDVEEHGPIDALVQLAEQCEMDLPEVKVPQDFTRDGFWSNDAMIARLRGHMMLEYRDKAIAESMRPAIMFRLCTQQCNDALVEAECEKSQAEEERECESARGRGGRGRGRGRGKGSRHTAESRRIVWERLQGSP